jgi:hypothetical protein
LRFFGPFEVPAQIGVVVGAVEVEVRSAGDEGAGLDAAFLEEIDQAGARIGAVFLVGNP